MDDNLKPIVSGIPDMPDIFAPGFRAEARRQSAAVAASAGEVEDQAFIDAVTDWGDE